MARILLRALHLSADVALYHYLTELVDVALEVRPDAADELRGQVLGWLGWEPSDAPAPEAGPDRREGHPP